MLGCQRPTRRGAPIVPVTAATARIVTDDLRRFWAAYDAGGREGDTMAFQTRYLDSATAGLRDFQRARAVTAASLARMVTRDRAYFAALAPRLRRLTASDPIFAVVRANYARIERLYPQAIFPPLTLLIGRFSTGGTTGAAGLLIGMEFYGRDAIADASAPLDELHAFARTSQFSLARDFPALVAHEHAHVMQYAAGARAGRRRATLLERALIEGGADFVGELASGRASYADRYVVWQAREAEYWEAFQRAMAGHDIRRWLYNQGDATPEWPGDLGYFMGYRIAQAFYAHAADKTAALRALIAQRDPALLLRRSGYDGHGPAITSP